MPINTNLLPTLSSSSAGGEAAAGIPFLLTSIIGFVSLVAVCVFVLIRRRMNNLPPGPRGLPLVGNLLSLDPELHTYFARLAQSYGPIYRLKLGTKTAIIIASPAVAKQVLKDNDSTFANRDPPVASKEAAYGPCDIAWSPYGAEWRMLRKICVREMLSNKTLDSVYSLRRRVVRQAVKNLYSQGGSPVDVGQQMFLVVMNVITNMLWGDTAGDDTARVGAEFKDVVGEMTLLLGTPNVSDFYPALEWLDLQGIQKKMKEMRTRFDKIFVSMIERRQKMSGESESKDFLQFLLQFKDNEADSKTPFTMIHLKALLMDMVVGGTDTTSNTIEFALSEMMNDPPVLKKAKQELDTVVGRDNIVEEIHINNLPYLYSIMKETLRLHPTLPLLVPHCPSATSTISGYTIPKGSRIFVNVWAIHRDPSVWENPLQFDPERFINGNWDFSGNDFSYFPFGSGRRICAGIPMAERMFMYTLASLLHSFDWSLPLGEKLDLSEKFGIVLKKKVPLLAIPTPRLSDSTLYE